MEVLIAVGAVLAILLLFVVIGGVLVNIGGQQVGILERRYIGRSLPEGRVVAMKGEVGIQARVLSPGLHVMIPFLPPRSAMPAIDVCSAKMIGGSKSACIRASSRLGTGASRPNWRPGRCRRSTIRSTSRPAATRRLMVALRRTL